MYIHFFIHIHMHMRIHTHVYICIYITIYNYLYVCMYVCVYIYIYIYIYIYVRIHAYSIYMHNRRTHTSQLPRCKRDWDCAEKWAEEAASDITPSRSAWNSTAFPLLMSKGMSQWHSWISKESERAIYIYMYMYMYIYIYTYVYYIYMHVQKIAYIVNMSVD